MFQECSQRALLSSKELGGGGGKIVGFMETETTAEVR